MDRELFERLKQEPNASKSTLQIESERSQREYQAALKNVKPVITAERRAEAQRRFDAINAANRAEEATNANGIIEVRTKELQALVTSALEVATPSEATQVRALVTPAMLKHWALYCKNYDVVEYLNAELQKLRAAKVLGL